MSDAKEEVLNSEIKHKGFFNYSEFYTFCYNWWKDEGYKLIEKKYIEKLEGDAKEISIDWEATKKITDYIKFSVKIGWHILQLKDAEVVVEGKKIRTNKGEVKIKLKATVERDYDSNWDKSPWLKTMRGFYDKYIIKTTVDQQEDNLNEKATSFAEDVKAWLNMGGRQ